MTRVRIYLKSGEKLRLSGEKLKVRVHRAGGAVTNIEWDGLESGDHLLYIDPGSVAAIVQEFQGEDD